MSDLSVRLSARAEKGLETDLVDVDDVGDESKTRHDGGEGLGQRAPRLIRLFPLSRLLQGRPPRSLASSALPLLPRSVLPPPQPQSVLAYTPSTQPASCSLRHPHFPAARSAAE